MDIMIPVSEVSSLNLHCDNCHKLTNYLELNEIVISGDVNTEYDGDYELWCNTCFNSGVISDNAHKLNTQGTYIIKKETH